MSDYAEQTGRIGRVMRRALHLYQTNVLARRIASALLLMPMAILGVWAGGAAFAALVCAVHGLMVFEWLRMVEGRVVFGRVALLASAGGAACFALTAGWGPQALAGLAGGAILAGGFAARAGGAMRGAWAAAAGPYLGAPCLALLWIRGRPDMGAELVLAVFFVVWATDSGAYLAGRAIGGPKLSPTVSPKKTWAGVIGGLVAAVCVAMACDAVFLHLGRPAFVGLCGAFLSLATQLGDVAESSIKRRFDCKDTGGFIPGHGGVLDRLDGMIFAVLTAAAALLMTDVGEAFARG